MASEREYVDRANINSNIYMKPVTSTLLHVANIE